MGDARVRENVMGGGKWTCNRAGVGNTMLARMTKNAHPQNCQHTSMYICTCEDHKEVAGAKKTRREGRIRQCYEYIDRSCREGEQSRS